MMRCVLGVLVALLTLSAAPVFAQQQSIAGKFDYYLLALSWSPTYCAGPGAAKRDPMQCNARRGFIVHGLWPQYEQGWPSRCASSQPRDVPTDLKRKQIDIIPSLSLIEHEWDTHGVCTGMTQADYFTSARNVRNVITIPPTYAAPRAQITTTPAAIRAAFLQANKKLKPDGLAIICEKGRLDEVRICFSKAGAPRSCGRDVKDVCPSGKITIPASLGAQSAP